MTTPKPGSTRFFAAGATLLVGGILLGFFAGRASRSTPLPTVTDGRSEPDALVRALPVTHVPPPRGPAGGLQGIRRSLDLSDPVMAFAQFADALQRMSATECDAVAEMLWASPGSSQEMTERKRLFSYRWGQLAGAEAVEFSQAQSGQGKVTALSAALAGWASLDPHGAKAWIEDLDPRARPLYDLALVDGWARADLAGATAHVLGLSDNPNTAQMMRVVGGEQARQDPPGAGKWALGLPAGALQSAALDEVISRWAWADPSSAVTWVAQMPDAAPRPVTMKTAMGIWARADPASAGAYLQRLPSGVAKDHAVAAFSQAAAAEDPSASADWAATISDPTLREESLLVVARIWMRQDLEAVRVWLPKSGLSEEVLAGASPP